MYKKTKNRIIVAAVIILVIALSEGGYWTWKHCHSQKHHTVKKAAPNVVHDGIDVSHHQKELNWKLLGKDDVLY